MKIFFSRINTGEYGFPYCGPFLTPRDHDLKYFNLHYINMTYSGSVALEKNIFK
jgi:hypothetical protein